MKIKESSIEEKIRVNTPDYVYGVSENISRYGCEFFSIHVRFKDGFTVHKGVDVNGVSEHMSGVPDFILLNRQDKEAVDSLCSAFEAGGIVEYTLNDYFCSRNGLYFIEAFGDYWHGKEITGVEMDEHENEVRLAYENAGHHVLILWEHDIVNSWNEKCLPLIRQFIDEFIADGNELPGDSVVSNEKSDVLSDEAVRAMHDVEYRSGLSDDEIDSLSNEVAGFYERHGVFDVNRYDAMLDYAKINKWAENGSFVNVTRFGKIFPWYLFGSLKHRIKNADGMSLYEFVSGKKAPLSNAVLLLMKSNNDVNMLSVLETHAGMNGFHDGMPFDFSEVLLRISHMDIERKDVFFDPACNCGETMYAAKMAGFKKYVGFVESRDRKEELLCFAEFIGYGNVSMYVVDYDSRMAFLTVLRPGMFTFTCCDDIGKLVKLSWMAENDHSFLVNTSLKDFRVISDSIDVVKMDYWRRNGIVKDWIYSFMKTDKYNLVRCLECGVSFSGLRGHALDSHGITTEQYVERHPGAQVTSLAEHDKIVHANQMKCRDGKRKYQKRHVYLLPDGGYASKADQYRRAWGVDEIKPEHVIDASTIQYVPNYAKNEELGIEGEDYVVCAICNEKKGSLTQHLRKEHNMTPDEYEKEFGLPVHSRKNQEAFHQCAVKKWKTQFGTGQSVHAAPRARVENPVNRKRDDITAEMILEQLAVGNGIAEMTEKFKCSDVTLVKYMREQGVEMPSRTVLAIRRAVHGGAERDLEHVGLDVIEMLLSDHGKEKTMQMFGVKRTVFDTWLSELRRKKEGGKSVEPAIEEAPKPAAEEKPAPPLINSDGSVQPSLFDDDDDALKGNEVETLVSRFRGFGFPYPSYSDQEAVDTIEKINWTRQMISDDGAIAQGATAGNDWLLSFFPNFFECRQNGKKSAVWMYENKLEHIVKDMLKYSPGKDMTNSLLRSYLMEHERVSGFRPVIAKQIYDRHCPDGAVVLDPCGGWGGRMLGAYCSDKVARYDCVDASSRTCDGLAKLSGELDRLYRKKETHVVHGAFEDLDVSDCFYDVVFTSTPYFTKELYSNDEEQSCNRYPEYNEWIAGFMRPFVMKSFRCLRPGGKFIVNIDDVRIKDVSNPLKYDFERIACEAGFRLVETMHMDYHNRYTGKEHGEPIYVMEKPAID